jgi:Helix-turn-helix domain
MSETALLADYLSTEELAAELKVTPRTVERWRQLGVGPPVTKMVKAIYYFRPAVTDWMKACGQRATA